MKHIYGPVESRRIGLSLGLTLTPHKTCNFNCIYCQLGRAQNIAFERKEYLAVSEILDELNSWLINNSQKTKELAYITLSGSGEPTLNSKIAQLIAGIKKISAVPVAVITNSSLLGIPQVRDSLLDADLIVPSLDAASEEVFRRIDRPYPEIKLGQVIQGLEDLRREFRGKIWLEVMLVKGINDDLRHIRKLKEVIDRIRPDKVQINLPVRSTAEPGILAPGKSKLAKIKDILGDKCEII